jgi:hypothetical protein
MPLRVNHRSFQAQVKSGFLIIVAITVPMVLFVGMLFMAGKGRAVEVNSPYRAAGGVMVLVSAVVLVRTARKWAKWFPAVCLMVALKAMIALFLGRTISEASLKTKYILVIEIIILYGAMIFLTLRYVEYRPESRIEAIALTAALVGIVAEWITEPNLWPLVGSTVVLIIPWLLRRVPGHPTAGGPRF